MGEQSDVLRVLLIEDNPLDSIVITKLLAGGADGDVVVTSVASIREALEVYERDTPDVVLTDTALSDASGLTVIDHLLALDPDAVVVVLTDEQNEVDGELAVRRGAQDYVARGGLTGQSLRRVMRYARGRKLARQEADERLRVEKAFAEQLIDSMPGAFALIDTDGRLLRWNKNLTAVLKTPEYPLTTERRLFDYVWPDDQAKVETAVATAFRDGQASVELRLAGPDRHPISFLVTAVRIMRGGEPCLLATGVDLTERRSMEAQLIHAQKLESLGRLAGGVAHDFNNMLAAVLSFSELLLMDSPPDDPRRGDVETIREAALRATGLTRQLLAFSRRQVFTPKVMELNGVITGLDRLLRRLIGEDIELVTVFGEGVGLVEIDPGQMESALVNLAVNARDAMPEGGSLTIETSLHEDRARIAVTDTGTGMTPDILEHIFEPFFTTKEPGKGTGLGLATVYGIVRQSGGVIDVRSEPGRGTLFTIDLPRVAPADGQAAQASHAVPGGTETIIVAEDNDLVRHGITATMTARGYKILQAVTGEEALRLAASHEGTIDLVLSDVVMPKMTAPEMLKRLRVILPNTRVLLMSGYVSDQVQRDLGTIPFIQKPFTSQDLARKVREVLDAGRLPA